MPPPIRSSTTSWKAGFVFEDTLEDAAADKVVDNFLKSRLRFGVTLKAATADEVVNNSLYGKMPCLKTLWKLPFFTSTSFFFFVLLSFSLLTSTKGKPQRFLELQYVLSKALKLPKSPLKSFTTTSYLKPPFWKNIIYWFVRHHVVPCLSLIYLLLIVNCNLAWGLTLPSSQSFD